MKEIMIGVTEPEFKDKLCTLSNAKVRDPKSTKIYYLTLLAEMSVFKLSIRISHIGRL